MLASGAALGAALVLGCPLPASAEAAAPAARRTTRCQITDPRLPELSGLVAGRRPDAGHERRRRPGRRSSCSTPAARSSTCTRAAVDPYDPEDMARRPPTAPSGSPTPATTTRPGHRRADRAAPGRHRPAIYRLTYPDGPHDAEALLLAPDGTPYVVTKEVLGASGVYRPATRRWSTAATVADGQGGRPATSRFTGTAGRTGRAGRPAAGHRRRGLRRTAARSPCAPTPTPTSGR